MSTPSNVCEDFASKPPSGPLAELNSPDSLGIDGWSTSIDSINEAFASEASGQWTVGYTAITRIKLKSGAYRADCAFATSTGNSRADATTKALALAVNEARKRALRLFHGTQAGAATSGSVSAGPARAGGKPSTSLPKPAGGRLPPPKKSSAPPPTNKSVPAQLDPESDGAKDDNQEAPSPVAPVVQASKPSFRPPFPSKKAAKPAKAAPPVKEVKSAEVPEMLTHTATESAPPVAAPKAATPVKEDVKAAPVDKVDAKLIELQKSLGLDSICTIDADRVALGEIVGPDDAVTDQFVAIVSSLTKNIDSMSDDDKETIAEQFSSGVIRLVIGEDPYACQLVGGELVVNFCSESLDDGLEQLGSQLSSSPKKAAPLPAPAPKAAPAPKPAPTAAAPAPTPTKSAPKEAKGEGKSVDKVAAKLIELQKSLGLDSICTIDADRVALGEIVGPDDAVTDQFVAIVSSLTKNIDSMSDDDKETIAEQFSSGVIRLVIGEDPYACQLVGGELVVNFCSESLDDGLEQLGSQLSSSPKKAAPLPAPAPKAAPAPKPAPTAAAPAPTPTKSAPKEAKGEGKSVDKVAAKLIELQKSLGLDSICTIDADRVALGEIVGPDDAVTDQFVAIVSSLTKNIDSMSDDDKETIAEQFSSGVIRLVIGEDPYACQLVGGELVVNFCSESLDDGLEQLGSQLSSSPKKAAPLPAPAPKAAPAPKPAPTAAAPAPTPTKSAPKEAKGEGKSVDKVAAKLIELQKSLGLDSICTIDADRVALGEIVGPDDAVTDQFVAIVSSLTKNIDSMSDDDKETIAEQFSSGVIRLVIGEDPYACQLVGGELVVNFCSESLDDGLEQLGMSLSSSFKEAPPSSSEPAKAKSGLSEEALEFYETTSKPFIDGILVTLAELLNFRDPCTVDADLVALASVVDALGATDKVGQQLSDVVSLIADKISFMDDVERIAVAERFSTGVIRFVVQPGPYNAVFDNEGKLIVSFSDSSLSEGLDELCENLTVGLKDSKTGLSISASKLYARTAKPQIDQNLATIQELLALPNACSLDVNLVELAAIVDALGSVDRVGEHLCNVVSTLCASIDSASDLERAAIGKEFNSGVVRVTISDGPFAAHLLEGQLVVHFSSASLEEGLAGLGRDLARNLKDPATGLSLGALALYNEKSKPQIDNLVAEIQQQLKLKAKCEIDFDLAALAEVVDSLEAVDQVGNQLVTVVTHLKQGITNLKDVEKAAVAQQLVSGRIVLAVGDGPYSAKLDGGNMVVNLSSTSLKDGLDNLGAKLSVGLKDPETGLTIPAAVRYAEVSKPKIASYLEELQGLLELPVACTLDVDLVALADIVDALGSDDKVGDQIETVLSTINGKLSDVLNDTERAAVAKGFTSGRVQFVVGDDGPYSLSLGDGNLLVKVCTLSLDEGLDRLASNFKIVEPPKPERVAELEQEPEPEPGPEPRKKEAAKSEPKKEPEAKPKSKEPAKAKYEAEDDFDASVEENPLKSPTPALKVVPVTAKGRASQIAAPPPGGRGRARVPSTSKATAKVVDPAAAQNALIAAIGEALSVPCNLDTGGDADLLKPELVTKILHSVKDAIVACDEPSRALLTEAFSSGSIKFEAAETGCSASLTDGAMVILTSDDATVDEIARVGSTVLDSIVVPQTSLTLRSTRNIAENLPLFEKHISAITDALLLDAPITIDVTWAEFEAAAAQSPEWKGRVGEIVYDKVVGNLRKHLVELAKEETGICARAIAQYWTSGQVMVVLDSLLEASPATFFDSGDIVIALHPANNGIVTGLDVIGSELIHQMLDTETNLSVTASLGVKANATQVADALNRIATAVQLPVEPFVDVDFSELSAAVDAIDGWHNRVGEVWRLILEGLATSLEELCHDVDVQFAVSEQWSTGTLRLMLDPGAEAAWNCEFLDGEVILTGRSDAVASQHDEIGKDIVDKI